MIERVDETSTLAAYSLESLEQMAVLQVDSISKVDFRALVTFPREASEPGTVPSVVALAGSVSLDERLRMDAREGRLSRFRDEALKEFWAGDTEEL